MKERTSKRGATFTTGHRTFARRELGGSAPLSPASGPLLWLMGDVGVTTRAGPIVTLQEDQSGNNNDVIEIVGTGPGYNTLSLDGVPNVLFSATTGLDNSVNDLVGNGAARTVISVVRPSGVVGGCIMAFQRVAPDHSVFLYNPGGVQYVWGSTGFGPPLVPESHVVTPVDYTNTPIIVTHIQDAALTLTRAINGVDTPITPTLIAADGIGTGFSVGNRAMLGFPWGFGFTGSMYEHLVWDRVLTPGELAQTYAYLAFRFPSI